MVAPTTARRARLGSAVAALAAAVGLLVGVRGVVVVELPGFRSLLRLPPVPHEAMALDWSPRALWPADLQAAALERMAGLVAALFLAAASVALLNALVLLFEAGASRRREIAVRVALGAGPGVLAARLLGDVRRLVLAGGGLGLLLGLAVGGAVRAAWSGDLDAVGLAGATGTVLPVTWVLAALGALAYVWTGLSLGSGRRLAPALASGERATADHGEAFRRRILAAIQMGAAGAVALGTLALSLAVRAAPAHGPAADGTLAVAVRAPAGRDGRAWTALLRRLGEVPGLSAESVATPGALVGLGVRDYAVAQCGACMRGGLPLPFWGARADHHAVGPGFFGVMGIPVLAGRGITAADGPGAPRVAVVNRTFANSSFEKGNPLGRLVRLGRGLDSWYEVVGVVEDVGTPAVGGDDLARAAVYVSALQQSPASAHVVLRGNDGAVRAALGLLEGAGYAPGEATSIGRLRGDALAPLRWTARLGAGLGFLTLLLAIHGGHATALQVTRRRAREVAIRRVLGATDRSVVAYVLAGSARTALGGAALAVFFGSLLVALLRKAAGGIPAPGPEAYVAVVALLVGAALLASVKAAREALAVEPGLVVE